MRRGTIQASWASVAGLLLMVVLRGAPLDAAGDSVDKSVYGAGAKVEGKSYAEWSAAWWQWALTIKKDRNPILDKTGAFAGEGQSGPVWFLAGNAGGKTTRKCVVPAGMPIFFSFLNYCETAPPDKADEKKLRAVVKAEVDRATNLEVVLDGKRLMGLDRFRVASPLFTVNGLDKADAPFEDAIGMKKAVSDGYWIMLRPLSTGEHTLRFKGKVAATKGGQPFELDVAYVLTVAAKK